MEHRASAIPLQGGWSRQTAALEQAKLTIDVQKSVLPGAMSTIAAAAAAAATATGAVIVRRKEHTEGILSEVPH